MLWWGWLFVGMLGFALTCRFATPIIDIIHDDHYLLRAFVPVTNSDIARCHTCGAPINRYYLFDPVAHAKREVEDEKLRAAVEREKTRIRSRAGRSLWQRLFPYRLKFERI